MKPEDLRVNDTYQTAFSGKHRRLCWKLLEFVTPDRVRVQRVDKPRITFELNAKDFASLVEP